MSKDKKPKADKPTEQTRGLSNKELIKKYEVEGGDMTKFHEALDKMINTPKPKEDKE